MKPKTATVIVPAPWTPIQITQTENEVVLEVLGRTYRLGAHAALPTSIQTAGVEILAGPIRLNGRLAGEPIDWQTPTVFVLEKNEPKAVLCGTVETLGVLVSVSVKVEYDGVIRFDMAITPYLSNFRTGAERAAGLEQLWVDIPLRPERATLQTHWPIGPRGAGPAKSPINSGPVPADGLALPFKPFVWLGWEEGGLSWFAESDRGWQPADPQRAIEVIPGPDATILRLHLLDSQPLAWRDNKDSWSKPNPPVTVSFGLQATPVKPVNPDVLSRRVVHSEGVAVAGLATLPATAGGIETILDRIVAAGGQIVVVHEQWNTIQNYWVNNQPEKIKALVAAVHARGLKILPYFGYELSTLAPEWAELSDQVLIKNSDRRYRGGWQRQPPQRDFMVCYQSAWQEKWLKGVAWMLDEYGFDGLYLDGTIMPSSCANDRHGCGYQQADGTWRETWPVFAVRSMMQRLYEIVTARDGMITAHQSSCCLTPTLAYCHTYWDGEHIDGAFKHDANGQFPLAVFRAEFMGWNLGVPAEFLSALPESVAYSLLHNVIVRPVVHGTGLLDRLDDAAAIWKVFGRFGTPRATWLPYWRNAHLVKADGANVYVSAYVLDARLLLVVANLSKEATVEATLALFPAAVQHPGHYTNAHDAVTGEKLVVDANRLRLACPPMSWKLIEVSGASK